MDDHLFLERFVWFDNETRLGRYPNAFKLADRFEVSSKTAQRSIDYFRDHLQAPLEYVLSRKGYHYTDASYRLPVTRITEAELLALLISRKLIAEASAGSLAGELEQISRRLGSLLAANLPGRSSPEDAFSFRWKGMSHTDPLTFQAVTSALLQGKLLTFWYHSISSGNCNMRTVEPHHMVNYLGNWHLIAFCHLLGEWRDFMLRRVTLAQVGKGAFRFRPEREWRPFLADSFGDFRNPGSFDVVLRFTPERASWVQGELWQEGEGGQTEEDGSLVLTIPVSHEAEMLMEILKHGSQVEVLEPQWLREKVEKELINAVGKYRCAPK